MKPFTSPTFRRTALLAVLSAGLAASTLARDPRASVQQSGENRYPDWREREGALITTQDWPGTVNKYYGQQRDQFEDKQRRIAKVDLDADLNYDGLINNEDPSDSGAFERTPPGLVVGVGELAKVIVRITPYRVDYTGEAVISMELLGINRGDRAGTFASFEEEMAKTSRIRVWADAERQKLLLDSHDKSKQRVEWNLENQRRALGDVITGMNLPFQNYPRRVYVEGVKAHGPFVGDVRILLAVEHRDVTPGQPSQPKTVERFRDAWETMLVTVTPEPLPKEWVVSEALQDVWLHPKGKLVSGQR